MSHPLADVHEDDERMYWSSRHSAQKSANAGQLNYNARDAIIQFEPYKGWVVVLLLDVNNPEAWEDGYEVQTPSTVNALFVRRGAPPAPTPAPTPAPAPTRPRVVAPVVAPGTVKPPWET